MLSTVRRHCSPCRMPHNAYSRASVSVNAAAPDPKVLAYQLPDKIHWTGNPGGAQQAIMAGDPSKPGLYVVLTKWTPHHMSRPHFHPNDRFIYVISGTW